MPRYAAQPPCSTRAAAVRRLALAAAMVMGACLSVPHGISAQQPLSVELTADPPNGMEGDEFTFAASVEGGAASGLVFAWDPGDGSTPVVGSDVTELRHRYESAGIYEVVLTVTGSTGGDSVHRLRVGVSPADPDFVGEVAGEVPRFPFRGVAGPSAALSGLSALGLLGGGGMVGGIVDLSGPSGVCLVNAGFWDDRSLAHIGVLLSLPADGAFEPRLYTGTWGESEGEMAPGQLMVTALVLWSDPTYEETKALASSPPGDGGSGGFIEMVRQGLAGEYDESPLGPGRNWQLTSNAGAIEVTRITPEVIEGTLQAYLRGTWQETDASGSVAYVQVEGNFTWPIDEESRQTLLACTGQD